MRSWRNQTSPITLPKKVFLDLFPVTHNSYAKNMEKNIHSFTYQLIDSRFIAMQCTVYTAIPINQHQFNNLNLTIFRAFLSLIVFLSRFWKTNWNLLLKMASMRKTSTIFFQTFVRTKKKIRGSKNVCLSAFFMTYCIGVKKVNNERNRTNKIIKKKIFDVEN